MAPDEIPERCPHCGAKLISEASWVWCPPCQWFDENWEKTSDE